MRIAGVRFTLVELMIVVAIIAVLAAIAIPSIYEMQLKTRVAEGPLNGNGLRSALVAYNATHDDYPLLVGTTGGYVPRNDTALLVSGKQAIPWTGGPSRPSATWDLVGWAPDGDVRCAYAVYNNPGNRTAETFVHCNVDGDNDIVEMSSDNCESTAVPPPAARALLIGPLGQRQDGRWDRAGRTGSIARAKACGHTAASTPDDERWCPRPARARSPQSDVCDFPRRVSETTIEHVAQHARVVSGARGVR